MLLLSQIGHTFSYGYPDSGKVFHVFRVNQRAIGELMIPAESKPGERWCIGYAEFCRRMSEDRESREWLGGLLDDVDLAAHDPETAVERVTRLQHQLIDLIDFLDPQGIRFPADVRTRFAREEIERQLST